MNEAAPTKGGSPSVGVDLGGTNIRAVAFDADVKSKRLALQQESTHEQGPTSPERCAAWRRTRQRFQVRRPGKESGPVTAPYALVGERLTPTDSCRKRADCGSGGAQHYPFPRRPACRGGAHGLGGSRENPELGTQGQDLNRLRCRLHPR